MSNGYRLLKTENQNANNWANIAREKFSEYKSAAISILNSPRWNGRYADPLSDTEIKAGKLELVKEEQQLSYDLRRF